MVNRPQSREALSEIERLYATTALRLNAVKPATTLATLFKQYRSQSILLLSGTAGLSILTIGGIALGKLTLFAFFVPLLVAAGVILGFAFPLLAFTTLFGSVLLERLNFFVLSSGKFNVRIDELMALGVAVGLGLQLLQKHELRRHVSRVPGIVPLLFFYFESIATTLLNHHHLQKGAPLLGIMSLGIVLYATIAIVGTVAERAEQVSRPLLIFGTVENVFALLIFAIAYYFWLPNLLFVQLEPASGLLEANGTMYEGNLLGHFSGAIVTLGLALILNQFFRGQFLSRWNRWLMGSLAIALLTLILTFSRGGWLGAVIGVIVVIVLTLTVQETSILTNLRRSIGLLVLGSEDLPVQRLLRGVLAGLVLAILAFGLVAGIAHTTIGQRVVESFQTSSGTEAVRTQNTLGALAEWRQNPIIGKGIGSSDLSLDASKHLPPWILSMGVSILHDSGIIGVLLFLWFLWSLYRHLWTALHQTHNSEVQALAIGIAGATLCMLVGAQFTNSMYLMILWFFLGLAAAMPLLIKRANTLQNRQQE